MNIEAVEGWMRRAAGAGALVFFIAVYQGLWRASRHAKGRASGRMPDPLRDSFAFLLPMSVLGFWLLRRLWRPLPLSLSTPARALFLVVGALLYFPGLALMLWGRFALGEMYNVSTSLGAELYADHRLVTGGPFALVRHPMYLGGQLAELGALLLFRNWATLLVVANIPVLVLRAKREEEALAAEFGEQWAAYRGRVPAWLPRI